MFRINKLIILSVLELLFPWEGEDIKNILLFTAFVTVLFEGRLSACLG